MQFYFFFDAPRQKLARRKPVGFRRFPRAAQHKHDVRVKAREYDRNRQLFSHTDSALILQSDRPRQFSASARPPARRLRDVVARGKSRRRFYAARRIAGNGSRKGFPERTDILICLFACGRSADRDGNFFGIRIGGIEQARFRGG